MQDFASRHGRSFLDSRLFISGKWFGENYAERGDKCRLPIRRTLEEGATFLLHLERRQIHPLEGEW